MPDRFVEFGETFKKFNPNWESKLWTDAELAMLPIADVANRFPEMSSRANVYRLWVIQTYGGVYVDTDVECKRSFDDLPDVPAFAGYERPDVLCNAVFGAVPDHPWINWQMKHLPKDTPAPWGPHLMTKAAKRFPDLTVFPIDHFYPYLWYEQARADEAFATSFAVHHWALSWKPKA